MAERFVVVGHPDGLHARPAADFCKLAVLFEADVELEKDGKRANARSITSVLTLGAREGDRVAVRAEGRDAEEAVDALVQFLSG